MPETVKVYFDYLCPFAWRAAELTERIAEPLDLRFEWQHFSLYQSNYNGSNGWQLWNEKINPDDESGTKGLLPFLASCAARSQGEEKFHAFRLAVLRARHKESCALSLKTLSDIAEAVGLHLAKFERDMWNPECRTMLAQEHYSVAAFNVFGTPTFHFASGHMAYFRIKELPLNQDEGLNLFLDYRHMLESYPYLETVKRPREKRN